MQTVTRGTGDRRVTEENFAREGPCSAQGGLFKQPPSPGRGDSGIGEGGPRVSCAVMCLCRGARFGGARPPVSHITGPTAGTDVAH